MVDVIEVLPDKNPFCYDKFGNAPCDFHVVTKWNENNGYVVVVFGCRYNQCTQNDCWYFPTRRAELKEEREERKKNESKPRVNPRRENR